MKKCYIEVIKVKSKCDSIYFSSRTNWDENDVMTFIYIFVNKVLTGSNTMTRYDYFLKVLVFVSSIFLLGQIRDFNPNQLPAHRNWHVNWNCLGFTITVITSLKKLLYYIYYYYIIFYNLYNIYLSLEPTYNLEQNCWENCILGGHFF